MPWALVKHWKNNEIAKKADRKYDLLKWGIETKEHISKKTIKNFKSGDKITVVYRDNEVTYTLKEFNIVFK